MINGNYIGKDMIINSFLEEDLWILASNFWNDSGIWEDDDVWKD